MDHESQLVKHCAREADPEPSPKKPFVAPKLAFVKPELTHQGNLADVTSGFFGTFTP